MSLSLPIYSCRGHMDLRKNRRLRRLGSGLVGVVAGAVGDYTHTYKYSATPRVANDVLHFQERRRILCE